MNDSKKEDNSPYQQLQNARKIEELKDKMRDAKKEWDDLPVKESNQGNQIKARISTINRKMSALISGKLESDALIKQEFKGRISPFKSKSISDYLNTLKRPTGALKRQI